MLLRFAGHDIMLTVMQGNEYTSTITYFTITKPSPVMWSLILYPAVQELEMASQL